MQSKLFKIRFVIAGKNKNIKHTIGADNHLVFFVPFTFHTIMTYDTHAAISERQARNPLARHRAERRFRLSTFHFAGPVNVPQTVPQPHVMLINAQIV